METICSISIQVSSCANKKSLYHTLNYLDAKEKKRKKRDTFCSTISQIHDYEVSLLLRPCTRTGHVKYNNKALVSNTSEITQMILFKLTLRNCICWTFPSHIQYIHCTITWAEKTSLSQALCTSNVLITCRSCKCILHVAKSSVQTLDL